MTLHTRKALRVTAIAAGIAALGAAFSGTALAADQADDLTTGVTSLAPAKTYSVKKDVSAKKDNDEDDGGSRFGGRFHHDSHGASDPYDYDLYNPAESYDPNECRDDGADRAPIGALQTLGGYNGDSADDCKVDSGDYKPKKTGYQGRDAHGDGGYNGYLGTNEKKLGENQYTFSAPGS